VYWTGLVVTTVAKQKNTLYRHAREKAGNKLWSTFSWKQNGGIKEIVTGKRDNYDLCILFTSQGNVLSVVANEAKIILEVYENLVFDKK
jgi:hypothetical protein